jgi:hypothetical protein
MAELAAHNSTNSLLVPCRDSCRPANGACPGFGKLRKTDGDLLTIHKIWRLAKCRLPVPRDFPLAFHTVHIDLSRHCEVQQQKHHQSLIMARLTFLLAAYASVASAFSLFSMDDFDALLLEKRQSSDPQTACHENCGFSIRGARQPEYCTNQTWIDWYDGCMECAVGANIWSMYGNSVSNAAQACGLSGIPVGLEGGNATASASASTTAASGAASSATAGASDAAASVSAAASSAAASVSDAAASAVSLNILDGHIARC